MIAVKAVLLAIGVAAPAMLSTRVAAREFHRADSSPDPGGNPACISWVQRAPYRNAGYDHEVEITNQCERAAECVVSTDVNPEPIAAHVDAGTSVTVLTYRGSPAYAFTAKVACRLAK